MKKRSVSLSHTRMLGSSYLLQQTKQNKLKTKTNDAPRTAHIIWSNKNIAHWKRTWYFCWWRGDARISPSFYACTSWIFLGVTWASPSLSFCLYFISLHHSSLPTLENSLHTKLNTILISNISIIKNNRSTLVQFWHVYKTSKIT